MNARWIRIWVWLHKWSSLVCTLFLLFLCLTGLPLIFHDEIEALSENQTLVGAPSAVSGRPVDQIIGHALENYRQSEGRAGVPLFVGFSADNPVITVTVGPRADAPENEMRLFSYDRQNGTPMGEVREDGLMDIILKLHTDMMLGLPAMLFLGVMGLVFVVALISGLVVYVPFMRRLDFGSLRRGRTRRISLLDEHNLLGAVILGWAVAIGLTGAINAFAQPLTTQWRTQTVAQMVANYRGQPPLDPARYASIDQALRVAQNAQPGLMPQFIGFPGGAWSSAHHYAIFFQGDTPLTKHLLTPLLIDAGSGELTHMVKMPTSMQALMLSRPLHFGDYGGLGLKCLWALLTLATIRVLWSGVMLWWGKQRRHA